MSITGSNSTFVRFNVPEIQTEDLLGLIDEKLQEGSFVECESSQEMSSGFATFDDQFNTIFNMGDHRKGEYVCFNFRMDQRKVPAAVLRKHMRDKIKQYRDENHGKYPSRAIKQEIHDLLYAVLLSKAEPQPSSCQFVWNIAHNWLMVGTTSTKMLNAALEKFEGIFGIYPIPLYHAMIGRKELKLSKQELNALDALIPNAPQGMMDGKFMGYEFLTWLWYMIDQKKIGSDQFEMHLGDKMTLSLPSSEKEKVTVTTESDEMFEAYTATQKGKMVSDVQLYVRKNDNEYLVTLDTSLWTVRGLKTPKQLPKEGDDDLDGMFLEKMFMIEECLTTITTVFRSFLTERLGNDWGTTLNNINLWIKGD